MTCGLREPHSHQADISVDSGIPVTRKIQWQIPFSTRGLVETGANLAQFSRISSEVGGKSLLIHIRSGGSTVCIVSATLRQ